MNKQTFSILAAGLILSVTACKKTDLQESRQSDLEIIAAAKTTEWKPVVNWNITKEEKLTLYNGVISDTTITSAIADNGLVLVYKKEGDAIHSLPFEENGTDWYYQVSENTIEINCDATKTEDQTNNQTFQYVIISAGQVKDLEAKGQTRTILMELSYEMQ